MGNEVEILTPGEVAELLRVKPGTVYTWIHRGEAPPFFRAGGAVRFRRASVLKWIEAKEVDRRRRNFED